MWAREYEIGQLLHNIKTYGISFAPDQSSIIFVSNETGICNAFGVSLENGKKRQLTNCSEHVRYVSIAPDNSRMFLIKDHGSAENTHLFVSEKNGAERLLTPGDRIQVRFMGWSPDERSFYCVTNERDERFYDLYKINGQSYAREILYKDSEGLHFCAISKDERYAAFTRIYNGADSDIYLFECATRVMKKLLPHRQRVLLQPACFGANPDLLYFLSNENSEYCYASSYDILTGQTKVEERSLYNIQHFRLSKAGRYRVMLVDRDASTSLIVKDCISGRTTDYSEQMKASVSSVTISDSERFMACLLEGDRSPPTLVVYDLLLNGRSTKLFGGLNADIKEDDLVKSKRITFESFDGLEIPGLLWKPKQAGPNRRVPALVWVHGGPGGQIRKSYSARIQFLVNHGYAILGVNHRGSSGYGKSFYAADERRQGKEPVWDCIEAKNYLASLAYVDASKIGIIGSSFGGYMVLAALAFHPEEFAVGVDIAGVSNWLRALENLPLHWHTAQRNIFYEKLGDPAKDLEKLLAISPIFSAHKIRQPLMVVQGARDPRVPRCEAEDIVSAVRKNGGVVEYLLLEDEAHAVRTPANAVKVYNAVLDFLDRYLKGH